MNDDDMYRANKSIHCGREGKSYVVVVGALRKQRKYILVGTLRNNSRNTDFITMQISIVIHPPPTTTGQTFLLNIKVRGTYKSHE